MTVHAKRALLPANGAATELARRRELASLVAACTEGASRVSFVIGEAGMGKSLLIDQLSKRLERDLAVVEVTSSPSAPLEPIFKTLRLLDRRHPQTSQRFATSDFESADRETLFAHLFERFRAHAESGTRTIVIEDVHWLDHLSLDFLEGAMSERAGFPFHLVLTSRPSVDAIGEAQRRFLSDAERDVRSIWLGPLDDSSIRALVANVAESESFDWIVKYSAGNPHAALELAEASALAGRKDAWVHVPRSLDEAIARKYERLTAPDRRVIDFAAAIGGRFDPRLLAAALSLPPLELADSLRRAVSLGLLDGNERGELLSFRHELTREALYGKLLGFEAREIHATIASNIEEIVAPGPERDLVAFEQWSRAGRVAEASRTGESAASYAIGRFAYDDAIAIFAEMQNLVGTPELRARYAERIANAHNRAGRFDEARDVLRTAIAECSLSADTEVRARLTHQCAAMMYNLLDLSAAEEMLDSIPRIVGERSDSLWLFRMHVSKALSAVQRGEVPLARRHLEIAEMLPVAASETKRRADDTTFLRVRGEVCAASADRAGWMLASDRAMSLALIDGGASRVLTVRLARAIDAMWLGELNVALESASLAIEEAETGKLDGWRHLGQAFRSRMYLERGDFARALADAECARRGDSRPMTYEPALTVELLVAAYSNDAARCEAALDRGLLDRTRRSPSPSEFAMMGIAYVEALLVLECTDEARALLQDCTRELRTVYGCGQTLAFVGQLGALDEIAATRTLFDAHPLVPRDEAFFALFEARVAARDGRTRVAHRFALDAAARFEHLGMPVQRAQALELAGRVDDAVAVASHIGYEALVVRAQAARAKRNRRGRRVDALTRRELDVARHLAAGMSNREIADVLQIGERTVETHVTTILQKSGTRSRREAAAWIEARATLLE